MPVDLAAKLGGALGGRFHGVATPTFSQVLTPSFRYHPSVVALRNISGKQKSATNLVVPPTSPAFEQIYVADWQTQSVQLASVNDAGQRANRSASDKEGAHLQIDRLAAQMRGRARD